MPHQKDPPPSDTLLKELVTKARQESDHLRKLATEFTPYAVNPSAASIADAFATAAERTAACLDIIQAQHEEIKNLKTRIESLEKSNPPSLDKGAQHPPL